MSIGTQINNIISILITITILWYVNNLDRKKCDCAMTWYHKYIIYFSVVIIILTLLTFIEKGSILVNQIINKYKILFVIYGVYFLAYLFYIVSLLFYFMKLKNSDCKCAEDWKQWMLLIPVIIFILSFIIGFYQGFKKNIKQS